MVTYNNNNVDTDMDWRNFDSLFSFEKIFRSHLVSRKCKRHKDTVIAFEQSLSKNIVDLRREVLSGTYRLLKYNTFYVYEPKKRQIQSCGYKHRVFQHCLCDYYLTPLLDNKLIYDNCACRKGKGVDFCIKRTVKFMREFYQRNGNVGYCLRVDISKYFASIDKQILLNKLSKDITNRYIFDTVSRIVNDYHDSGLPIGNQTSQLFAIYYLNDLDRFIKEVLRIKHYVRYMDDLLILHSDKEYLDDVFDKITDFARKENLKINPKSQIVPLRHGVDFIGRRFSYLGQGAVEIALRASNKRRMKRKLTIIHRNIRSRLLSYDKYKNILASYWGLLKRGGLRKSMYKYFIVDHTCAKNDKCANQNIR